MYFCISILKIHFSKESLFLEMENGTCKSTSRLYVYSSAPGSHCFRSLLVDRTRKHVCVLPIYLHGHIYFSICSYMCIYWKPWVHSSTSSSNLNLRVIYLSIFLTAFSDREKIVPIILIHLWLIINILIYLLKSLCNQSPRKTGSAPWPQSTSRSAMTILWPSCFSSPVSGHWPLFHLTFSLFQL